MRLLPGGTKFSGFIRQQNSALTAGATVTAAYTTIIDLAQINVNTDDYVFLSFYLEITKGATSGTTHLEIGKKGGSATLTFAGGGYAGELTNQAAWTFFHTNAQVERFSASAIFRVTAGGTLTLGLHGLSVGSNATVLNGGAGLGFLVASIGT